MIGTMFATDGAEDMTRLAHGNLRSTARAALLVACASMCSCPSRSPPEDSSGTSSTPTATATTSTPPALARGRIAGAVTLTGRPPVMRVPPKRRRTELCKSKEIPSNAVVANAGKLRDVLVRLAGAGPPPDEAPPERPVVLRQVDCTYAPRMIGAMVGQTLALYNDDLTLHQIHDRVNGETLGGSIQLKGPGPTRRALDREGVHVVTCDVHPWMRAFVVVSPHRYFDVTREDGGFAIEGVPVGNYEVEAFHSWYGWKRVAAVSVREGETAHVAIAYATTDPVPRENEDEARMFALP